MGRGVGWGRMGSDGDGDGAALAKRFGTEPNRKWVPIRGSLSAIIVTTTEVVGETIAESGFLAVRWQRGGALNDGVGQGPKNIILQLFKKMSDGMRAPTMRGRSFCRIAVTSRDRSGRGSILGLGQGVLLGLGPVVFLSYRG